MYSSFTNQVKKQSILLATLLTMALIIGNFTLYCYNRIAFIESMQAKATVEEVENKLDFIWTQVQISDMGVRGYLLVPEELMAIPLHEAAERYPKAFDELETLLTKQGLGTTILDSFKRMYVAKMEEALLMKKLKQEGHDEQVMSIFKKDTGYQLWLAYKPLHEQILAFENKLKQESDLRYENSLANTLILQVVLLFLSIPILCLVIYRLRKTERQKKALFNQVMASNNEYLFCEKDEQGKLEEEKVIIHLVENLQKASAFIGEITKGNYQVTWQGINQSNESLNQNNLSGQLLTMQEQMKKVKNEEKKGYGLPRALLNLPACYACMMILWKQKYFYFYQN